MGRVAHIQQVMSDRGQCMTRVGYALQERTLYTSHNARIHNINLILESSSNLD